VVISLAGVLHTGRSVRAMCNLGKQCVDGGRMNRVASSGSTMRKADLSPVNVRPAAQARYRVYAFASPLYYLIKILSDVSTVIDNFVGPTLHRITQCGLHPVPKTPS
jgi:hypothetical protein